MIYFVKHFVAKTFHCLSCGNIDRANCDTPLFQNGSFDGKFCLKYKLFYTFQSIHYFFPVLSASLSLFISFLSLFFLVIYSSPLSFLYFSFYIFYICTCKNSPSTIFLVSTWSIFFIFNIGSTSTMNFLFFFRSQPPIMGRNMVD